jgi:hypothetical protein
MRRLLRLLEPDQSRFILVRTRDRVASGALIEEVLGRRAGLSRVVLHCRDPALSLYRFAAHKPGARVIRVDSDDSGSIDLTARALNAAGSVVTDSPGDLIVRMLWLPPSVLEGYAQLPASPESVLVIDDWHTLVKDYLVDGLPRAMNNPAAEELDRLLADAFEALSEAHLIVVTSGRAQELENVADAIIDVGRSDRRKAEVEIRIDRDVLEPPPNLPYLLPFSLQGRFE